MQAAIVRKQVSLGFDPARPLVRPDEGAVTTRRIVRPTPGQPPLEALIVEPASVPAEIHRDLLVYFPGFGMAMGPWEIARCRILAATSGMTVVTTELPGMSRFGHPIPPDVRAELLRGDPKPWAVLTLDYLKGALLSSGRRGPWRALHVLGYSTGCSLAIAALPELRAIGEVREISLVEPVAITDRRLGTLQAHNTRDWLGEGAVRRTNRHHDWVRQARASQSREPRIRYEGPDVIAIANILSASLLAQELATLELPRCNLVRATASRLCPANRFAELDHVLADRGVPGDTITVARLGHQFWHSYPAVVPLIERLVGPAPDSAARTS